MTHLFRLLTLALGLTLISCGSDSDVEISHTRSLANDEQTQPVGLSDGDRFGTADMMRSVQPAQSTGITLDYALPEGWKDLGSSGMRDIDLRFGENDEGECSVVRASGQLVANVNRWRSQMGLEPTTEAELDTLEQRTLFGIFPAKLIELEGAYTGFGAAEAQPDFRMVALVLSLPEAANSFFIKMTGPRELVLENEAKFHEFSQGLRPAAGR